jgi:hypothetical protein
LILARLRVARAFAAFLNLLEVFKVGTFDLISGGG